MLVIDRRKYGGIGTRYFQPLKRNSGIHDVSITAVRVLFGIFSTVISPNNLWHYKEELKSMNAFEEKESLVVVLLLSWVFP